MSTHRSIYGRALDEVVDRLAGYCDRDLESEHRAFLVFFEIASTPCMWPLDDVLYELLLTTAGFDLADAVDLHGALWATALLVAGDPTYDGLYCGHGDTPSALCALNHDTDLDEQYRAVMDLATAGSFDVVYAHRRQRCTDYGIADPGPGELPGAA